MGPPEPEEVTDPGHSVMIVDDDVDIRQALAETLEEHGYDVITASNGLQALRILNSTDASPTVILLDLMMPIMDGYTFLSEQQRNPEIADIPVAIVTAGHGVDEKRLGGAPRILPKPFKVPRLLHLVRELQAHRS